MARILIVPSIGCWISGGNIYLENKFHDGMFEYRKHWHGEISLLIRESTGERPVFGCVEIHPDQFFAELRVLKQNEEINAIHLEKVDVILAAADDHTQLQISKLARSLPTKSVYILENIFKTRAQFVLLDRSGWIKKCKQLAWLLYFEWRLRVAIRRADGLQANGVPAYRQYGKLTNSKLLYFDTRVTSDMAIDPDALALRLDHLAAKSPLRLAFSGRLVPIKGVMHLLSLAKELKRRRIPFSLDILGDGELFQALEEDIRAERIGEVVKLHGALDFNSQLLPFIKDHVDIFVCCHLQSDPSCTYLETYSCGVPILGYDNLAHKGILDLAPVGWSVPMGNIVALADEIERLNEARAEIARRSIEALNFASQHTFEKVFMARMAHCKDII